MSTYSPGRIPSERYERKPSMAHTRTRRSEEDTPHLQNHASHQREVSLQIHVHMRGNALTRRAGRRHQVPRTHFGESLSIHHQPHKKVKQVRKSSTSCAGNVPSNYSKWDSGCRPARRDLCGGYPPDDLTSCPLLCRLPNTKTSRRRATC